MYILYSARNLLQARRAQGSRLRKATLEGDWGVVISLITKNLSRLHHKRFLYAVYRQVRRLSVVCRCGREEEK